MTTGKTTNPGHSGHSSRYLLSLVSIAAMGVALTVIAVLEMHRYHDRSLKRDFVGAAENRAELVELALTDRLAAVQTIGLLYDASTHVDRDEFSLFVEPHVRRFASIRRLAWIPSLPHTARDQYETAARRDGLEGFAILDMDETGRGEAAPEREGYLPIYYVEPHTGNTHVLGFDLATDPATTALLDEACETGRRVARVSAPEGNTIDPVAHWEIFTPVYDGTGTTYTAEGRQESLRGYLCAVIDLRQVIEEGMEMLEEIAINVQLWDTENGAPRLLCSHMPKASPSVEEDEHQSLSYERKLAVGEHQWLVRCTPGVEFAGFHHTGTCRAVMLGGLLLTAALTMYMQRHLNRAFRVEKLVVERTEALTDANSGLQKEIRERRQAESELRKTQERLVEAARRAGMADVASEVLHNVGNILNSINVSTTQMTELVSGSRLAALEKVTTMLSEHRGDLGTFLTQDAKGQHIPVFLAEASRLMKEEEDRMVEMLNGLAKNVRHIKDTISMQQSYAKVSGIEERTALIEVIEDAIQINRAGLDRHGVRLVCEFEELPPVYINKQKLLQILVNLVNNGKYALNHSPQEDKVMRIRLCKADEERFRIQVADNGVGIDPKHRDKMFQHGFTTKKDGHGFGLHSSAQAAEEMGGSLSVHSDGLGKGATFTLELPLKQIEATTCKTKAM